MRNITFFSVLLGLVFVFSSCGSDPTDVGTSTSALSWKNSSKSKHINHKNHKRMSESFDTYADGSIMPDKYHWVAGGKALGKATKATARSPKNSLQIGLPQDPTGSTYMGSKFCLSGSVDRYLHAKFSIKFANFVDWTAFGASDGTLVQYWWWTRGDGTVFDDTTFDKFALNTWQDGEIIIDRDNDLATVTIAGKKHTAKLTSTWNYTDHKAPMQCLFFFASSTGNAQNMFVDDITVVGH